MGRLKKSAPPLGRRKYRDWGGEYGGETSSRGGNQGEWRKEIGTYQRRKDVSFLHLGRGFMLRIARKRGKTRRSKNFKEWKEKKFTPRIKKRDSGAYMEGWPAPRRRKKKKKKRGDDERGREN